MADPGVQGNTPAAAEISTCARGFPRPGRRPAPEPDALRVPGAVAEGAASGPGPHLRPRAASAGNRLRGRRDRDLRGAGRPAPDAACHRRTTRLGIPAAVAVGGHRTRSLVFHAGTQFFRAVRVHVPRTVIGRRMDGEEPVCRFDAVRRSCRGDRLAMHRAVHGRRAGLRICAACCRDARHFRGAGFGDGAAVHASRMVSGLAALVAAAGSHGWSD